MNHEWKSRVPVDQLAWVWAVFAHSPCDVFNEQSWFCVTFEEVKLENLLLCIFLVSAGFINYTLSRKYYNNLSSSSYRSFSFIVLEQFLLHFSSNTSSSYLTPLLVMCRKNRSSNFCVALMKHCTYDRYSIMVCTLFKPLL